MLCLIFFHIFKDQEQMSLQAGSSSMDDSLLITKAMTYLIDCMDDKPLPAPTAPDPDSLTNFLAIHVMKSSDNLADALFLWHGPSDGVDASSQNCPAPVQRSGVISLQPVCCGRQCSY